MYAQSVRNELLNSCFQMLPGNFPHGETRFYINIPNFLVKPIYVFFGLRFEIFFHHHVSGKRRVFVKKHAAYEYHY